MRRFLIGLMILTVLAGTEQVARADVAVSGDGLELVGPAGERQSLSRLSRSRLDGPSWAPDGRALVAAQTYGEPDREGRQKVRLVRVDAASGATSPVPGGSELFMPAWSPDGTTIAAVREIRTDGDMLPTTEIVVLPAAGGTPRTLLRSSYALEPAWSPDGRSIAFTRVEFDLKTERVSHGVAVMGSDGSGDADRGAGRELAGMVTGWPHARRRQRARSQRRVVLPRLPCRTASCTSSGADGTGARRLTFSKSDEAEPAWSPDGTRLAFTSDRHYPDGQTHELYVTDVAGTCVTQVTFGPAAIGAPAWRPGTDSRPHGPCGGRLVDYHDTIDLRPLRGATRCRSCPAGRSPACA